MNTQEKSHGPSKVTCSKCGGAGRIECPDCEGSGKGSSICPVCCSGEVYKTRWINCAGCHGTGRRRETKGINRGNIVSCWQCGGRGQVKETYKELCPNCHGEYVRKADKPCKTCNGTGKIECDLCKGVGELDVEALCLPLIDVANEGIHKGKISREMVGAIKDAADKGHGMAAYVMGRLYGSGGLQTYGEVVVPEDMDEMLKYLRIGAEAGNLFAQGCYGNELRVGVDGSSNHKDGDDAAGYPWIFKAAEQGDVLSLHRLSYDYLGGSSYLKVDIPKALECFRAILAAKDAYAWNKEWIERAKGYVEFLPEIINGKIDSMCQLAEWIKKREGGWGWSWGLGDAQNESSYWLKKAADQGDPAAMSIFGQRLRTGDGMEKDARRSLVYLYRAAEKGEDE